MTKNNKYSILDLGEKGGAHEHARRFQGNREKVGLFFLTIFFSVVVLTIGSHIYLGIEPLVWSWVATGIMIISFLIAGILLLNGLWQLAQAFRAIGLINLQDS